MKALKGLMEKVRKGEGGFTLIELLIVIIILGILAAVVAFNVGGFLGAGTLETAKTQKSTLETAVIAGMADNSVGALSSAITIGGGATGDGTSVTPVTNITGPQATWGTNGTFYLGEYLSGSIQGDWVIGTTGIVTNGVYAGGGKTCTWTGTNWTGC